MKKISTLIILIITFVYYNLVLNLILQNDPLYEKIYRIKNQYEIKPIDPIENNDFVIIGKNGKKLKIKESYFNMKKYNKFNEDLLVYKTLKPKKKIKYNKYIRNSVDDIAIIIIVHKEDINEIINLLELNNIKVTLFIEDNNFNSIFKLLRKNNDIGYLGNNKYKRFFLKFINKNYELIRNIDKSNINKCIKNKFYPIYPIIINKKNIIEYKNYVKKGNIVAFENLTTEEISIIFNYVKSRNLNIKTINKLI